ncbi:uncharacterized protein NEMAJ01_1867 [Nematocida major]|uniref:uncharacterized protein n=1 Tax=Nematocida major TaxID=1912982 RepID=UPI00200814E3|nr:uncharacterized protein NEMAJ01_1867 [Nematocida major]KAH9386971.1 hypothetical protein NEMAJ01_1867 [Nematocida major]
MLHIRACTTRKVLLSLFFASLQATSALSQPESTPRKSIAEAEKALADTAVFIVFTAPVSWEALVFQTYVQKRTASEAFSLSREAIFENIAALQKILKDPDFFTVGLKALLTKYERTYIRGHPSRNKLFEEDVETPQVDRMQRKSITENLQKLTGLSQTEAALLREDIAQIMKEARKQPDSPVWTTYKSVIEKALLAMKSNASVKNSMEISTGEFSRTATQLILKKPISQGKFNLERARFNLGGAVYSPSLMLEIVAKLQDEDKSRFVDGLVDSLLQPLEVLRGNLSGSSPSQVKEEIIRYMQAVSGTLSVYPQKKEIAESQAIRSESICRRIKNLLDKKPVSQRIDEIQIGNTKRMASVLQEASPDLFKEFLQVDRRISEKYKAYIKTGGGDEKVRKEIEALLGVL